MLYDVLFPLHNLILCILTIIVYFLQFATHKKDLFTYINTQNIKIHRNIYSIKLAYFLFEELKLDIYFV